MPRLVMVLFIAVSFMIAFVWLISIILVHNIYYNHLIVFADWFLFCFYLFLMASTGIFIGYVFFCFDYLKDFYELKDKLEACEDREGTLQRELNGIDKAFNDPERHLTGMRKWYYYKHKLPSIICKYCFKSIVVKDITFTCPYCNHFYPSKEYKVSMESVLFDHCPHCGRPIKQLTCIHCDKDINLFEEYDPNKLINQEFKRE